MDVQKQVLKLMKVVTDIVKPGFFGRIVISVENGRITLVRKEETIKLD